MYNNTSSTKFAEFLLLLDIKEKDVKQEKLVNNPFCWM